MTTQIHTHDIADGAVTDAKLASSFQPADSDLTAIAGLDSSTSGAIASDGAGWIKKTYAQFKTALGLSTADVPDSTNKRYVTDAELVVIGNTSGTNSGDQTVPAFATNAVRRRHQRDPGSGLGLRMRARKP